MDNLKKDLLQDIEYLKNKGIIYDTKKITALDLLIGREKYDYKTKMTIKDIISILDIDNNLIGLLTDDIVEKYFKEYKKWIDDLKSIKKEGGII